MRARSRLALPLLGTLCLASPRPALAAHQTTLPDSPPASAPAATTETAPATKLLIRVLAVDGDVRVRAGEAAEWQAPDVGMELAEGTQLQTGLRSRIRLGLGTKQVVEFDRLGSFTIARASVEGGIVFTDLVMEYGRTKSAVEAEGVRTRSTIRSPSSTLAIRGTRVTVYDQPPFVTEATSADGRAEFRNLRRRVVAVGGRGRPPARVTGTSEDPADTAIVASVVDPTIANARTPAEERLIQDIISRGGSFGFDPVAGIDVVRGGGTIEPESLLADPPGALNFVLTWTGDADLNLGLNTTSPRNLTDFVYPIGGLSNTPNLGRTLFDHRGGAGGGFEIIALPSDFPGSEAANPCNPAPGDPNAVDYNQFVFFMSGEETDIRLTAICGGAIRADQDLVGRIGPNGLVQPLVPRTSQSQPTRSAGAAAVPSQATDECGCHADNTPTRTARARAQATAAAAVGPFHPKPAHRPAAAAAPPRPLKRR
jgi:hypothetical protein